MHSNAPSLAHNSGWIAAGWQSERGQPAWCRSRSRRSSRGHCDQEVKTMSELKLCIQVCTCMCLVASSRAPAHDTVTVLALHARGHTAHASYDERQQAQEVSMIGREGWGSHCQNRVSGSCAHPRTEPVVQNMQSRSEIAWPPQVWLQRTQCWSLKDTYALHQTDIEANLLLTQGSAKQRKTSVRMEAGEYLMPRMWSRLE